MEAERPAVQGTYSPTHFLVPKIRIIKCTFTVAIFIIQGFDHFTISKGNMLTYFTDDLMMAALGKQAVAGTLDAW